MRQKGKDPGLRLARPDSPRARVFVLFLLHEDIRRPAFQNAVILLKCGRWAMSKKLSEIVTCFITIRSNASYNVLHYELGDLS